MRDYLHLDKLFADFKYNLTESQITDLLAGNAEIKIESPKSIKKNADFDLDETFAKEVFAKLNSFESEADAEEYILSLSLNVDKLRKLSKHYSIPKYSKLTKQGLINELIATTVGARKRFKAL